MLFGAAAPATAGCPAGRVGVGVQIGIGVDVGPGFGDERIGKRPRTAGRTTRRRRTLAATEAALEAASESPRGRSRAVHLGGGFHHAHRGGSSAPTPFNDVVAAVERARRCEGIDRIAVVDFDVHHHDGTRAVYRLDGDVYLFSMHGWNLFPGTGWIHETGRGHAAGNHLNAPLPADTDGRTYLAVLERLLPPWLRGVDPDFAVVIAGADVHAADPIGTLRLSVADVHERDRFVAERVGDRPLVAVLGGGYGPRAATIHANTAAAILEERPEPIRTPDAPEIDPSERPTPGARSDEVPRVTARRWLSALVDHCERRYGGFVGLE